MSKFPFPSDIPLSVGELRDEFDRLLDRVWHGGLSTAPLDGQDWAPRIDVYDIGNEYHVRVEVPGLAANEVNVSILASAITVKGTKLPPEQHRQGVQRLRSECRYGSFNRRYQFPDEVNDEGVSASFKDGVLLVKVPKIEAARGRSVRVEAAE
jgi:HSP20 family protein